MNQERCITINGTEVWLQGQGDEVILMLHGWPDTRAFVSDAKRKYSGTRARTIGNKTIITPGK